MILRGHLEPYQSFIFPSARQKYVHPWGTRIGNNFRKFRFWKSIFVNFSTKIVPVWCKFWSAPFASNKLLGWVYNIFRSQLLTPKTASAMLSRRLQNFDKNGSPRVKFAGKGAFFFPPGHFWKNFAFLTRYGHYTDLRKGIGTRWEI